LNRRRSRYEILEDVLRCCREAQRLTGIVYHCNLNFGFVQPYLEVLLRAGFLRCEEGRYRTTEKGREWLESFKVCKALWGA